MARTRANGGASRSPLKKIGGQQQDSDGDEGERAIQTKKGAAAAARMKKAQAAKKAKKVSVVGKKKRSSAKKPSPAPVISEDEEPMGDNDAEVNATEADVDEPAPSIGSLSYNYNHLTRYLGKATKSSFNARSAEEKAQITEKIARDLQRINFWVGERAGKSSPVRKRKPVAAAKGTKKSGKGKGRAKAAETDEDEEEENEDMMDEDEDAISEGKLPFHSLSSLPASTSDSHYRSFHYAHSCLWHSHYSIIPQLLRDFFVTAAFFALFFLLFAELGTPPSSHSSHYSHYSPNRVRLCRPDSGFIPNPVLTTILSSIYCVGHHGIHPGE
jgi:hypothetical protein